VEIHLYICYRSMMGYTTFPNIFMLGSVYQPDRAPWRTWEKTNYPSRTSRILYLALLAASSSIPKLPGRTDSTTRRRTLLPNERHDRMFFHQPGPPRDSTNNSPPTSDQSNQIGSNHSCHSQSDGERDERNEDYTNTSLGVRTRR